MINPPPDELFAERPVRSDFAHQGPSYGLRRFITVFVLIFVIGVGLYLAFGRSSSSTPEEIPTIKAEGSYKQRPEQPGGIDIPHQDVEVYQALDVNGAAKPTIEHLLPPPETPQPADMRPPIQSTGGGASSSSQPESLTPAAPQAEPPPLVPLTPTPPLVPTTVTPLPATTTPSSPPLVPPEAPPVSSPPLAPALLPPSAPVPTPKVAKQPKTATINDVLKDIASGSKTTGPVIQLASIPDPTAAQQALEKLQSKYASVLGNSQLRLAKADLGAKGIYYRIQSQSMTEEKAKSLCAALKNLNAGCIIVRP